MFQMALIPNQNQLSTHRRFCTSLLKFLEYDWKHTRTTLRTFGGRIYPLYLDPSLTSLCVASSRRWVLPFPVLEKTRAFLGGIQGCLNRAIKYHFYHHLFLLFYRILDPILTRASCFQPFLKYTPATQTTLFPRRSDNWLLIRWQRVPTYLNQPRHTF